MASSELVILDVGHGNCAIVLHDKEAIVIDAPARPVVAQTLDELGVERIHALVVSHADSDHLSGAVPILLDERRPIGHVYVNGDGRTTESWTNFRRALATARKLNNSKTAVHPSLSLSNSGEISLAGTTLHILHPQPEMCLAGTGGKDLTGFRVDANNMSAVVLVEHEGERICLLAADSDQRSLSCMIEEKLSLEAPVLVFPHHGGRSGRRDHLAFARELVGLVKPDVVLFSLGRGAHGTPRPDIVDGVREAMTDRPPYVACTQLSANCADALPIRNAKDLNPRSDGFSKNACCAGTITIKLEQGGLAQLLRDLPLSHGQFVSNHLPKALCRRALSHAS
jgi:competence protein ComEC